MSSSKTKKKPSAPAPPPEVSAPEVPAPSALERLLLAGAVILLVAGATAWLWLPRSTPVFTLEPAPDQNVLLVTIDTLRADALGVYGGPASTPNLDRLAAQGARFTFAHSHAVVTLPSHTTILTGRLPYEHGMRDNSGFRVKPGTETLATRLKPLGFATGAFVGGFPLTKRFGLTPGFDEYDDQMPEMEGAVSFSMPERPADQVIARANAWIEKQPAKFFAWVHLFDAHSPYRPPDAFAQQYAAQPYYGEVSWIDHALAPLLARLAALSRPTVVIVTADHGESLGEHGELTHGMFAYEPTLHVPLIVARVVPKESVAKAGKVIDTPVRHIDIAPTILESVGAKLDGPLTGTSLLALIRDGSGPDRPAYFESMTYNLVRGWAPLRGVLVDHDKYIDQPIQEFYELAADPKEERNQFAQQRDRADVMVNTLKTYNMAPPDRPGRETAQNAAALRALGYTGGSAPEKKFYTEADDLKRLAEIDRDLHTAQEHYQNGRLDAAIAALKSVIERRPDTADAYLSLAHAYWQSGQPLPAIQTLEQGLKAGAPERDLRIRLGLYLAESHSDTKKAILLLEGLPPDDVEALNGLGVAYTDAGRYQDAIKQFRTVLTLDPTNGLAFQNLAAITLKQRDATSNAAARAQKLAEAETLARQSLASDPALAGSWTILGVILSTAEKKGEAIEAWKKAIDIDPGEFYGLYNLWLELGRAGRADEARRYGQQFINTAPPAFFRAEREQIARYLAR